MYKRTTLFDSTDEPQGQTRRTSKQAKGELSKPLIQDQITVLTLCPKCQNSLLYLLEATSEIGFKMLSFYADFVISPFHGQISLPPIRYR